MLLARFYRADSYSAHSIAADSQIIVFFKLFPFLARNMRFPAGVAALLHRPSAKTMVYLQFLGIIWLNYAYQYQ